MFAKPAVVFTDLEAWAVGYLATALAARAESFTEDVTVSNRVPDVIPARLVTVRDDGGSRSATVTKSSALGVNVWASSEEDASDLARMVVALLENAGGDAPVVGHSGTSGPVRVPEESGTPHWFASVDLVHRGASL